MYKALAFASPIHGDFVHAKYEEVKRLFPTASGPYFSAEDAPPAKVAVIIPITGGTSAAIAEYARRAGAERVVLFGLPEHNSLASALSARSLLEAEGIKTWVFHCPPGSDCSREADMASRVAGAVASLHSPRVLLIGRRTAQTERFEAKFNAKVDVMSIDDFAELVRKSEPDPEFLRVFGRDLADIARIYSALKGLGSYDGVAVTCFPYIQKYGKTPCLPLSLLNSRGILAACEGDLQALTAMFISRALTDTGGWIANVAYVRENEAFFAHCTINLGMAKAWRIMPHFETGKPAGLAAELPRGLYTGISVGPLFDRLGVGLFEALETGNMVPWACRTQMRARPLFDGRRLLELAPANHHVLAPGDLREALRAVSHLLDMRYVGYSEGQ